MRRWSLAILPVLLLPACGGSSNASTGTPPVASRPLRTTKTASTPKATTPVRTVTVTVTAPASQPSGPGPCVAADLTLTFLGQQGATGHGVIAFALRNTSPHSCRTYGYPGILFLDRSGAPLPTVPTHTTRDFFGSSKLAKLVVAPGGTVSFRLGVTHGAVSSAGCTTARGLQVIPPDDTATLRVAIPQGAYECATATVSPLQAGTSAYA